MKTKKKKALINQQKEMPEKQKPMKSMSEESKFVRNNLHFKEGISDRVQGFARAQDHKSQVKRDFQNNKGT